METLMHGSEAERRGRPRRLGNASDCEVKLNAFNFSAGSMAALPPCDSEALTRSGLPIISMLPGASILKML